MGVSHRHGNIAVSFHHVHQGLTTPNALQCGMDTDPWGVRESAILKSRACAPLQVRREAAYSASSAMAGSAVPCSTSANVEHVERMTFDFLSASSGDMPRHQQQLREWIHRYTFASHAPLYTWQGVLCFA